MAKKKHAKAAKRFVASTSGVQPEGVGEVPDVQVEEPLEAQETEVAMPVDAPEGKQQDALSKEFYKARKEELKGRVNERRFRHILGVAKTAKRLAKIYDVDPKKAKLAGLLHDWDKGYDDEGIRARALEVGLDERPEVLADMPQVLHGRTAALALGRDYPCIPADVLQAIDRHTSGAVDMTDLDMVVYIADCIEPGRAMPEVQEIRDQVGTLCLEDLFFITHGLWIKLVIGRRRTMHPDTLAVWNTYALHYRERLMAQREAAGLPPRVYDPNNVGGDKANS